MVTDDDDVLFVFNTYEEFQQEREKLNYENTLRIWYSLPSGLPNIDNERIKRYTSLQQRKRMGKVSAFAIYCILFKKTSLRKKISAKGARIWHETLNLDSLADKSLFEFYEALARVTSKFVDKAERYDSKIVYDELFKASRLVWWMAAFQLQLSLPLDFTDSMFGYNMLYPYTDDLVDSNDIPREAKKDFADAFHQRLLFGESNYDPKSHFNGQQSNADELDLPPSLKPYADRIVKIFDMVKFIENDWTRDEEHSGVYMSLATIHDCQMKSTLQHARPKDGYAPKMALIEEISAQKGGASIIAAGFLIEGKLTRAQMAYLEYVGFGLQLLDDLQDVEEDMKNNHRTIFTQSIADGQTLDAPTARLIQFLYSKEVNTKFLDSYHPISDKRNELEIFRYIHDSMTVFGIILILEAAGRLKRYYSKEFYRDLSKRAPVTFRSLKKAHIEKRMWSVFRRNWF
ncbi:unnamed protein product [Adineta ricciae]|uniref:Uncharacterized protein n=1 Tax=Adineta ricciae TaxID=249248 RepID=A0A814RZ67_ADIRI|nr:unnamed protein product [Adineta ricciae]CAF1502299.1 unnamed protein product [Adineta ricciae]